MTLPSPEPLDATFAVELPLSPYPGLRPFEPEEWPIFFGREELTDEVIKRLVRQHLVVVHGDSGCGKSSLVRAGVLVQLEQERARSGVQWRTCHMRPREAPLRNLVTALAELDGAGADLNRVHQIHRTLNHGRETPAALAELLRSGEDDNICILVDQFEELFSFAKQRGRDEAQLFVDILVGLQQNPPEGLYVILTMRSEFLGVCARFTGLAEAVNQTQYLLPQMERPALLRAIREPATLYDGEVSRELAERLIADAGGDQDQLPLIQHGLMLLWRRKTGAPTGMTWAAEGAAPLEAAEAAASYGLPEATASFRHQTGPAWQLGLEDYRGAGGLAALLSEHADQVMAKAAPDEDREKIVEHLFRALTDINAEGNAVRRPQTLAELTVLTGSDEPTLRDIVDRFRADGVSFLRPYYDEQKAIGPDTLIDISHEALIRCWRKIADKEEGWLQREFQDGLTWESLRVQAGKFARNKEQVLSPAETEYSDRWLTTLPNESWPERYGGGWRDVQDLMAASREEAKRQRELETERRREAEERADQQALVARRLGYLSAALALVMLLAALAGLYAWQQRQAAVAAEEQRSKELFDSQMTHAALLADGEDYARAKEVLAESRQLDYEIPLEGRHARDFLARYVDTISGAPQRIYEGAGAQLFAVAVSPDGALLAAVGENRTVALFDVESGTIRQRLEGHSEIVRDVAFHPEGAWLVTGGDDGQIIRWSLPTDEAPAKQLQAWNAHDPVWSVDVSPDGQLLATGGTDNDVSLWKAETGEFVRALKGHADAIAPNGGLAFSPSGQRLASASYDHTARVWNVTTGESVGEFGGHSAAVTGVVFAGSDNRIATISGQNDRRAALWDVESRSVRVLAGHANGVFGVDYMAGGPQNDSADAAGQEAQPLLITGSFDRTLRVWDADTGVTLRVLQGHLAGVNRVAVYTPEAAGAVTQVFSASNDGTVRRWDIAPLPHQYLLDLPGEAKAAAIAPDGTRAAVGFADGSLRLYAIPAGRLVGQVTDAHRNAITRLNFNANGTLLASASYDATAKLWSFAGDGEPLPEQTFTGHDGSVEGIALSPDGKTLATASFDGRVGLFKIGAKDEGRFINAHDGGVQSIAFDASGTRLLSAGYEDKTARLWDLTADPPALIRAFPEAQDNLMWAALSPDDRLVAAVGRGWLVDLYKADDGQLLRRLVGHEQTVWRAIFSPDGRQLATVSADATVRLWDLDTGAQLFALYLPAEREGDPLWDFDFRCTPTGCWLAVPLTRGKLALYDLGPYAE